MKNIEIIERENLVGNSRVLGAYFRNELESIKTKHKLLKHVRGLGMLLALEFFSPEEIKNYSSKSNQIEEIFNKYVLKE